MPDKTRGDYSDRGTPARKTKKIQLEIYEDHEASFYLALSFLKTSSETDLDQVKLLLDAIHFNDFDKHELINVQKELETVWDYIQRAGKHSEDYRKVAGESFDEFSHSEFSQSIATVLQHFTILKDVAREGESVLVKTQLSALSRLFQSIKEPFTKAVPAQVKRVEQISEGTFKVIQANVPEGVDVEFYIQYESLAKKVLSFDNFDPDFEALYLKTKDFVIKVTQDERTVYYSKLSGAVVVGDTIDVSNATETRIQQLPKPSTSELDELYTVEMSPHREESTVSIEKEISLTNDKPLGIMKELENIYIVPENGRKDLYLRQKAMTAFYGIVDQFFPNLTSYTKSIVTGYLCIPLGIVDTEDVHNESERTQTYHEYLGKTVRNTLKSKPFASL